MTRQFPRRTIIQSLGKIELWCQAMNMSQAILLIKYVQAEYYSGPEYREVVDKWLVDGNGPYMDHPVFGKFSHIVGYDHAISCINLARMEVIAHAQPLPKAPKPEDTMIGRMTKEEWLAHDGRDENPTVCDLDGLSDHPDNTESPFAVRQHSASGVDMYTKDGEIVDVKTVPKERKI